MRLEWLRGDKREVKTINLMCTNHQFVLNTRRKFLCDGNRSARHLNFLIRYGESILNSNRFCDVNCLLKDFRKALSFCHENYFLNYLKIYFLNNFMIEALDYRIKYSNQIKSSTTNLLSIFNSAIRKKL